METKNITEKEGVYTRTLRTLKENKVDLGIGHIVCGCESAWKSVVKKGKVGVSFDDFCKACEEVWLDCDDGTGLTTIADKVAYYLKRTGELPCDYDEVYDDDSDDDDEDEEEN